MCFLFLYLEDSLHFYISLSFFFFKQKTAYEMRISDWSSDVCSSDLDYYQDLAERIARETPGAYFINQFGNPDNPAAHEFGTGPEILRQMADVGGVDAVVFGCGSSGTMSGLSRCFAQHAPGVEMILADPVGSILAAYINEGTERQKSASWKVDGLGEDLLPTISDFSRVKKAYAISDKES